jgi:hypothetical protein
MIASSWKEAKIRGISRYLGKPCRKCGSVVRRRSSKHCVSCDKPRAKRWLKTEAGKAAMRRHNRKPRIKRGPRGVTPASKESIRRSRQRQLLRPEYRLARALRDRLAKAVKRRSKSGSAVADLGCSIAHLIEHIEAQFEPGWTWGKDSWGPLWHLDHIKPLARFDLADRAQLAEACHWTNLRPYPAALNMREGARLR